MFLLAVDNLPRLLLEAFEDRFQFALGVLIEVSGVLDTLQCEPCHSRVRHLHMGLLSLEIRDGGTREGTHNGCRSPSSSRLWK